MSLTSKVISFSSPISAYVLSEQAIKLPPGPNQVIVEVTALALNPVDVKLKPLLPFGGLVGRDYAGTVRHAGSEAEKTFKVGDKVFGYLMFPRRGAQFVGSYAVVDVTRSHIGHIPEQLDNVKAAALPLTFSTAWEQLEKTQIAPAGKVLVLGGATAVGSFMIQLLKKKYNVAKVVATCSAKSADYVKSFGADEVIDYTAPDFTAQLLDSVADGKYVSILDTVGDGSVGYIANQLVAEPWADSDKSNFTSIAGPTPPSKSGYSIFSVLFAVPKIFFRVVFGRLWGIRYSMVQLSGSSWHNVLEFLQSNEVEVPVDSVVPYNDALSAVDRACKANARGKLVIEF